MPGLQPEPGHGGKLHAIAEKMVDAYAARFPMTDQERVEAILLTDKALELCDPEDVNIGIVVQTIRAAT